MDQPSIIGSVLLVLALAAEAGRRLVLWGDRRMIVCPGDSPGGAESTRIDLSPADGGQACRRAPLFLHHGVAASLSEENEQSKMEPMMEEEPR
jgi:hypothetical protein